MTGNEFISKRLRASGTLIILGLLVEALSLIWNHPLSFVVFLGLGGLLLLAGIVGLVAMSLMPETAPVKTGKS